MKICFLFMFTASLVALLSTTAYGGLQYLNAQSEQARTSSISSRDTVPLQHSNVATGQMPLKSHVAFMRLAVQNSSLVDPDTPPPAIYDEQLGLTFTQNFNSIAYNVTVVQQVDSRGYGPAYLLNGVTDEGYWYQVGVSFDWPYTNGGYDAGFHFNYEVFDNTGKSIFPASGGGLESFSGPVRNGDNVLLNLYFSSGNVMMYAYDWSTGASATVTYTAVGGSSFQGQTGTWLDANGFFTGLMTEWWHSDPYYGGEAQVVYNDTTFALSSGWLWADEWVPSNKTTLFTEGQQISFSNPTQLQYFSTNGAFEAASEYLFITGAPAFFVTISPGSATLDVGQSLNFTSSVSGGTSPYTYQWYLNGVAVSSAISVAWTLTPSSAGSYTVYVEVTDAANDVTASNTSTVTLNLALSVTISPPSAALDVGQSKLLISAVSGGTSSFSYQWYLNGQAIPGATGVAYSFYAQSAGPDSIYVTVTDSASSPYTATSNTANVTVNSAPTVSIAPESWTLDVGQSETLNATTSGGTGSLSYQWYLNGAPVSTGTSATWTFSPLSAGSYSVYVTVTDIVGVGATSNTANITVNDALSVSVSPTSFVMDVSQSETFTSTVSGGTPSFSYQWYLNGVANGTGSSWTLTPDSSGSYSVYVNVTDNAGMKVQSNVPTITVNKAPSVSVSPTSVALDIGQSLNFTSSVSGGTSPYTYQWYLNGVAVSGVVSDSFALNPTHHGTYSIYVTLLDGCGLQATSNTVTMTVNPVPVATVSFSQGTVDVGQNVEFTSAISGGTAAYSYQWYVNEDQMQGATSANYTFTPSSVGGYNISLVVHDAANYQLTLPTEIAVNPALAVSISGSAGVTDVGRNVAFTASNTGGTEPVSLQWYVNGTAVTGATSAAFTYVSASSGTFDIYVVATDGVDFGVTSSSSAIRVNNDTLITNFNTVAHSSSILYSNNMVNASASISGGSDPYTYEWYLNGASVGNTTSPTYTYVFGKMGQQQMQVKITDSAGYVVESNVLSTNYSYNYVLFVLLAVLIIAVIGALAFVLRRRASKSHA